MAKIHISEIQKILVKRGERDAIPERESGFFLEIRFDEPNHATTAIDEDFQQFDDYRRSPLVGDSDNPI